MKRPNCPYCGRPAKIPDYHRMGAPEPGICGTRWYQDYGPEGFRAPVQTDACKEICRLDSEMERVRGAGVRLLAGVEDYLAYKHNGDPWTEDARTRQEMDLDELRGAPIAKIRTILAKPPTPPDPNAPD